MTYYIYFAASIGIFAVHASSRAAADRIAYWNAGKSTLISEEKEYSRVDGFEIFS